MTERERRISLLLEPFAEQVQAALDVACNSHAVIDLVRAIAVGEMQMWVGEGCVVVSELSDAPQGRVCHIFLAAGDLDGVRGLQNQVADWARGLGCVAMTLSGRRGWVRALDKLGWREVSTVMRLDL